MDAFRDMPKINYVWGAAEDERHIAEAVRAGIAPGMPNLIENPISPG